MSNLLFGVSPRDRAMLGFGGGAVGMRGFIACLIPEGD